MPAELRKLDALVAGLVAQHVAAERARDEGRLPGPAIPFPLLAREFGGCWPAGLFGIHASPSAGKTALALQFATEAQCPALIVSAEMGSLAVFRRLIARKTNTFKGSLDPAKMSSEQIEQLANRTAEACPDVAILGAASDPVSFGELKDHALATRGEREHLLVIVDSLHAWAASQAVRGATENESVNRALIDLRQLADELQATVLFVAHQSKAVVRSGGGGMSGGASTRHIEYDADALFEVWRPRDDDDDESDDPVDPDSNPPDDERARDQVVDVMLKIVKNRDWGRAGVNILLHFEGRRQSFKQAGTADVRSFLNGEAAKRAARARRSRKAS